MNVIDDEDPSTAPNANLVLDVTVVLLLVLVDSSALLLDLPGGLVRNKAPICKE